MTYDADRQWSERYLPAITSIVGPLLIQPADIVVDRREATDLIILHARDMRIAARVRRPGYADRYPHDFTVRAWRPTGVDTEYAKIMSGWGDWFLYGHAAHGAGRQLARWVIVDLDTLRRAIERHGWEAFGKLQGNGDGVKFIAFNLKSFDARGFDLVVDQSHPPPRVVKGERA